MLVETISKNNIAKRVSNGVGLCYFDPGTEEFREFDANAVINLTPFEHSVRRFYFVKSQEVIDNKIPTYTKLTVVSNHTGIDIKLNIGGERITSKYDFYDSEINNTVIAFFKGYPNGIIPIDLLIKSGLNEQVETDFQIYAVIE